MIEADPAIFLGLVFIFIKLRPRTMLRLLRYDMAIDVAIHWGTFSGVMAVTFAGLLTSIGTTLAKKAFGYIDGDRYHCGYITLKA